MEQYNKMQTRMCGIVCLFGFFFFVIWHTAVFLRKQANQNGEIDYVTMGLDSSKMPTV
jgi:hypothetical protein